jgi:hypothetical protein
MHGGAVNDITEIIQRGYGDSSISQLDRTVAHNIVNYLANKGWMSPGEVAYLVEAAGGEIRVPESLVMRPPKALTRYQNPVVAEAEFIFRTTETTPPVDVTDAKVNPDAESRAS